MPTSDEDLLALAEQATPDGASPLGEIGPPETELMGSQLPAGTPGSDVEGPVKAPWDNPVDLGVNPDPQPKFFTPEDQARESAAAAGNVGPNADPNVVQNEALAAEPVQQIQAPPAALDAVGKVGKVGKPPAAPVDPYKAPNLRTGEPTMGGAAQALDQATQAGFDVARAQADVGKAKGQEREANAQAQDKVAGQTRKNLSEVEIKQAAQEAGRAEAQRIANAAEQEAKDFKIDGYWANKSTGEHILSNIFVGLGAAGAALSGVAGNPALENLKMLMADDLRTKQAKLGQKENFAKMKREGATSLENTYKSDMATLLIKQGLAADAVSEEAKAQALRNGMTVEQAENNVLVQGTKQLALQFRAKGQEQLWDAQAKLKMLGATNALAKQKNDAPAAPNGAENKAYDFAGRLKRDHDILDKLGPMSPKGAQILREQLAYEDSVKPEMKAALIAGGKWRTVEQALGESGDPADVDRYVSGHRMATSSLRPDSGAAISGGEYLGWSTDHIPQPGDTPSSVEAKRKAREGLVRGQAISSGRPNDFGFENPGGVPKPGSPAAKNGKPVVTTAPVPAYSPEMVATARAALKPNSGATDTQRANARKIIGATRN